MTQRPGIYYSYFAVFIFCAIALIVPSGYSLGAALLLLGGLYSLLRTPTLCSQLRRAAYWFFAVFFFYAFVLFGSTFYHEGNLRQLDKPLRFLLAPLGLFLLLRYPVQRTAWWLGTIVGGWSTGLWAMQQKFLLDVERATGYTHKIQYGNLSMLLGLWCLAGLLWARQQKTHRRLWTAALLSGAVLGILGSLLSGSRGGWVGLPLVALVFYRAYADLVRKKIQALIALLIIALATIVYYHPAPDVQHRIHEAVSDVQNYFVEANPNTALGARFEMWQAATQLISERPLLGWGEQGYRQGLQRLVDEGTRHSLITRYGQPHNEVLNMFVKHGLLGLLALILIFALPFRLFGQGLKASDLSQRANAVAGVLLAVTFIDFGLTQGFLTHNSGTMMYAFGTVFLWGLYRPSLFNDPPESAIAPEPGSAQR